MPDYDNFATFMGGLLLLCFLFIILYVIPLSVYVNNNLNTENPSTWEQVSIGTYGKCTDIYGVEHYYLDDTPINLDRWRSSRTPENGPVDIYNLLVGNKYTIYAKHFWWPYPTQYLIISESDNQPCKQYDLE